MLQICPVERRMGISVVAAVPDAQRPLLPLLDNSFYLLLASMEPGHPQGECPYYTRPSVYSRDIPLAGVLVVPLMIILQPVHVRTILHPLPVPRPGSCHDRQVWLRLPG